MQRTAGSVYSRPNVPTLLLVAIVAAALFHSLSVGHDALLRIAGLVSVGALSFANGANDLPKTIATLYGSGEATYRRSLFIGAGATVAGGLIALVGAGALLELFSGGGITTTRVAEDPRVALVIASSSAGWVLLATRVGLPVSTTHALVGGSAAAALLGFGLGGVNWNTLFLAVVIPLVVGPLAAALAARLLVGAGNGFRGTGLSRNRGRLHVLSAGVSSGSRALNDTPKIAGVGLVVLGLRSGDGLTFDLICLVGLIIAAMTLGGVWASWRVNRTLGFRLTTFSQQSGPAANVTTATMVGVASLFGLPLSTTHVSGAAMVGATGALEVRWKVARQILGAWVVTVPGAALLAVLLWFVVSAVA